MPPAHPIVRPRASVVALLVLLVAALTLAGCTGAARESDDSVPTQPTQTATGEVDPPPRLPDSEVGAAAAWVLEALARETAPTALEVAERFSPAFLSGTPAANVVAMFDALRPYASWRLVDVDAVANDAVVRLHDGAGRPWRLTISVAGLVDDAGAITSLFIRPDTGGPREPATNWAEVYEQLTAIDDHVSLLAAEVTLDGRCVPITAIAPAEPMPMASIFKLYVFGALVEAVEDGSVGWYDELVIDDDVRSLPSGQLQDEPNGTAVTVARAAAGMIADSDNTGADLLAARLGEPAIMAAVHELGHATPELNTPFLTTREFFTAGWGPLDRRDRWRSADLAGRQRILDEMPAGTIPVIASDIDDPAWEAGVDWFGSAEDVCAAQVALHEPRPDPANTDMMRTILGHDRGDVDDTAGWPYVAYKGGSAPGVLSASWLSERADGKRYFFSMQLAAGHEIGKGDRSAFFDLGQDAFALLSVA